LRFGLAAKITVLVAVAIVGQVVTRAPEEIVIYPLKIGELYKPPRKAKLL